MDKINVMSKFNYATTRNKPINAGMPSQKLSKTEEKIAFDAFIFVAKHSDVLNQHNKEWLKKFITDVGHQFHTGKPVTTSQLKLLLQFEREIKQTQPVRVSSKIKPKYAAILATLKP
jgi:hypothetical protein